MRTGNKLRTGPQRGGCRPLIYSNVVSRYFSKMLFEENPGKCFAFALLSLLKKSCSTAVLLYRDTGQLCLDVPGKYLELDDCQSMVPLDFINKYMKTYIFSKQSS